MEVGKVLRELCDRKGVEIIEAELMLLEKLTGNYSSLFKIPFLAMKDITAKWYGNPHNWGLIISQLMISFPDNIRI